MGFRSRPCRPSGAVRPIGVSADVEGRALAPGLRRRADDAAVDHGATGPGEGRADALHRLGADRIGVDEDGLAGAERVSAGASRSASSTAEPGGTMDRMKSAPAIASSGTSVMPASAAAATAALATAVEVGQHRGAALRRDGGRCRPPWPQPPEPRSSSCSILRGAEPHPRQPFRRRPERLRHGDVGRLWHDARGTDRPGPLAASCRAVIAPRRGIGCHRCIQNRTVHRQPPIGRTGGRRGSSAWASARLALRQGHW